MGKFEVLIGIATLLFIMWIASVADHEHKLRKECKGKSGELVMRQDGGFICLPTTHVIPLSGE